MRDPLGVDSGDINLYGYAFNSYPNVLDPSGTQGWKEFLLFCGLVAAFAWLSGCGCEKNPDEDPCDALCASAAHNKPTIEGLASRDVYGGTTFCFQNGALMCACIVDIPQIGYRAGSCPILDEIGRKHENGHLRTATCPPGSPIAAPPPAGEECTLRKQEVAEINAALKSMSPSCQSTAQKLIAQDEAFIAKSC